MQSVFSDVLLNHKNLNGIAGTAALAALYPLIWSRTTTDVMAGYGHFMVLTLAALGAAYRPNEDLMSTVGSTVGGLGDSNAGTPPMLVLNLV